MKKRSIIITCEHAVNHIPGPFKSLFANDQDILKTHRAYDPGAREIATYLSERLGCHYAEAIVSRLLIDCNRSLHHAACFSEFSKQLSRHDRQEMILTYYQPYRNQVYRVIHDKIKKGFQIIHCSIHSFTPVLNGKERDADIGLLYDPKRPSEKKVAGIFKREIKRCGQKMVRMNYPYKGISDGFTQSLRKVFEDEDYVGIEIESNQKFLKASSSLLELTALYENALKSTLNEA